jgi:hypothetical protein
MEDALDSIAVELEYITEQQTEAEAALTHAKVSPSDG